MLILCEVLRWKATEVAELLETSVASVNSALQRARATLEARPRAPRRPRRVGEPDRELLDRYVEAFEATTSSADVADPRGRDAVDAAVRPLAAGRDDIFTWWFGPGHRLQGLARGPDRRANGSPAFGQYKPAAGERYEPWALQVLEISDGRIVELTFFLDTERVFPLFGLPRGSTLQTRRASPASASSARSSPETPSSRSARPRRCAAS